MRLTLRPIALAGLAMLGALTASIFEAPDAQADAAKAPKEEDLLGVIPVTAQGTGQRVLPKIGVVQSLSTDMEDVTLRGVMRRDLDLCGEYEVLPDKDAPEAGLSNTVDIKAWEKKNVEAVVKVVGKKAGADKAELRAIVWQVKSGETPIWDKTYSVPLADVREESHRLADLVIGALTGYKGGFASRMVFTSGSGSNRQAFQIDADGNNAKRVSTTAQLAIAPAIGKNEMIYYSAAEKKNQDFSIFTPGVTTPIKLPVTGSVYSMAWSRDRAQLAVAIGNNEGISIFTGADFGSLKKAFPQKLALHPAFSPSGKVGYSGEGKYGQRIYLDGKPISPDGLMATAPTFCKNPDGVKVVYSVGAGKNNDLVSSDENGKNQLRLTSGAGRNSYPACSPDGRLVAFFSTRKTGEGEGLYIMRLDGFRPKRISNLTGQELRWEPLPAGKGVEVKN